MKSPTEKGERIVAYRKFKEGAWGDAIKLYDKAGDRKSIDLIEKYYSLMKKSKSMPELEKYRNTLNRKMPVPLGSKNTGWWKRKNLEKNSKDIAKSLNEDWRFIRVNMTGFYGPKKAEELEEKEFKLKRVNRKLSKEYLKQGKNSQAIKVLADVGLFYEAAKNAEKVGSLNKAMEYYKKAGKDKKALDLLEKQKGKMSNLEKSLAVLSISSIMGGIFFLSPNLTGNVISNISKSSGNILGAILFVLGILGMFFIKK